MKVSFSSGEARKLWRDTVKRFEMPVSELFVLRGACMALDKIALLEAELDGAPLTSKGSMGQDVANPLLSELRSQQAAFDRAMKQLDLPEEDGSAGKGAAGRSASAREAAMVRWGMS